MKLLTHRAEEIIDGFIAAALVVCSGSVGWAMTTLVGVDPELGIVGATGLASSVVAGGFVEAFWNSDH